MEKTLIVADKDYDAVLFSYKNSHPSSSIKIIHPDEFASLLSFSYELDPIPFLIKLGYDYDRAKKAMKALLVGEIAKNQKLKELYKALNDACYLKKDPYGKYELSQADLCFFELNEDIELHALAKRNNIPYRDLSVSDLSITMRFNEDSSHPPLFSFKNKFQQFSYIYSDIRRRLLNGEDANKIRIHVQNESDLFYVSLCSCLFGVESFMAVSRPFISDPIVSKKIQEIHAKKAFVFLEEEKKDPSILKLAELVDYYGLASLPFDAAYASLLEALSSLANVVPTSDRGVMVCADSLIDMDSLTYVTDFVDGSFYKTYEDNHILSDEDLLSASINPSYVLTSLDRRKKLNYIRYSNIALLSSVEEHLKESIYPSQFMSELPFYKRSKVERISFNENGIYTSKAKELFLGKQLDDAFYFKPHEEFRSYDHSYQKIEGYVFPFKTKSYSITKLESYIDCPFKFLMSDLLPSNNDDYHALYLGKLIHKVMERIYDDDFSFDDAFRKGKEVYLEEMLSHHQKFAPVEEAYLKIYYPHLKRIVSELRAWKMASSIQKEIPEQKLEWDLLEGEKKYHFSGRIDKIIQFGKDNSPTYYYLIDYKTGLEEFNPKTVFLGKSTQLPLYYYAFELDKKLKESLVGDSSFAGFGIQQMYASSVKSAYGDNNGTLSETSFYKKSAFKGVVLSSDSEEFWHLADETSFVEKKGSLVSTGKGTFMSNKGSFITMNEGSVIDGKKERDYSLSELLSDAISSSLNVIHAIEDAKFPIAPTNSRDLATKPDIKRLSCAYCSYKDICYHNAPEDYVDYSETIKTYFADKKGDDDDGE